MMNRSEQTGLSLIELMIATLITGVMLAGMYGVLSHALNAERYTLQSNDSLQQARFAMQEMVNAVRNSPRLLVPLGENPVTAWSESVRSLLAVTLDPRLDRNSDGWADANNDKDFLDVNQNGNRNTGEPERIDEDTDNDASNDDMPGIIGIDDDGDGSVDEGISSSKDDDEDGVFDEDKVDGVDNDNDGTVDEDFSRDMNGDARPGLSGVDDDLNGTVDDGGSSKQQDDDEDSVENEDWLDPVVFYLNGTTLMQRIPKLNAADGTEYSSYVLAQNVTQLRVERIPAADGHSVLVDIRLTLSPPNAEPITLNAQVRVGGNL